MTSRSRAKELEVHVAPSARSPAQPEPKHPPVQWGVGRRASVWSAVTCYRFRLLGAQRMLLPYEKRQQIGALQTLRAFPGTGSGQRLRTAWTLLTRGRRLELKFPDITQEGDLVRFGPAEMATTAGYEIEFDPP